MEQCGYSLFAFGSFTYCRVELGKDKDGRHSKNAFHQKRCVIVSLRSFNHTEIGALIVGCGL